MSLESSSKYILEKVISELSTQLFICLSNEEGEVQFYKSALDGKSYDPCLSSVHSLRCAYRRKFKHMVLTLTRHHRYLLVPAFA